ncbi:MAG: GIY-YIG nuclease family protein [Spirochaetes bacterium]|nr:MAG: GIY-YIG nuclease family protein [Spirochaetota bacterium]
MYILECSDGTYYTGSTWNLEKRLIEHNAGMGAHYTAKRLPVVLAFYEEFNRIDDAFYREKQVQGWSHKKKHALIEQNWERVHELAECRNETHCRNAPFDSAQGAGGGPAQGVAENAGQRVVNKTVR